MSKLPIHRAAAPRVKDKLSRGLDKLPEVELLRPWRGYLAGARIRPPGVLRQVLLQQKLAKMVEAVKPVAPKAKAAAPKKTPVKNPAPKAKAAD